MSRPPRATIACAAAAAAGLAGFAWYHGRAPTSQLYGRTICRVPDAGKAIALTFDDGPNPRCTPQLLDMLARRGAAATFMLIGRWAEREPGLVRELRDAGHAIGNHTYTHPRLAHRTRSQVRGELWRGREAIESAGVELSAIEGKALMRPPYGRRRPGTLRAIRREGYVPVMWSVTCYDWRRAATPAKLVRRAGRARAGDIVLLHDGASREPAGDRSVSLAAADEIVARLTEDGYRFVTIPELVTKGR